MEWSIGADPELFLQKDGKFVSAYGMIEGTKEKPLPVPHGAVQVDGTALEFNIDPSSDHMQFEYNINQVLHSLRSMIPGEFEFVLSATADFDPEYLASQPEMARLLGCDPDYNAYTGELNPQPEPHPSMRTAAGHVHIGWTKDANVRDRGHIDDCIAIVKELDVWLGLWSVTQDKNKRRREMYGKAGAFRPKPYGVEYRVLSNFWLASNELIRTVFQYTNVAMNKMTTKSPMHPVLQDQGFDIQEIINTSNTQVALHIIGEIL